MIDVIYGIPKLRTCNVLKEKEEKKERQQQENHVAFDHTPIVCARRCVFLF